MGKSIELYQRKDGTWNVYDNTYDIIIHCESTDEQLETEKMIQKGQKSLELWHTFIEKLAEKCNGSTTAAEWNIHRKAIELIKAELEEKIG